MEFARAGRNGSIGDGKVAGCERSPGQLETTEKGHGCALAGREWFSDCDEHFRQTVDFYLLTGDRACGNPG